MYSHWKYIQMPNCTTCIIPQGRFIMSMCTICKPSPGDWEKHIKIRGNHNVWDMIYVVQCYGTVLSSMQLGRPKERDNALVTKFASCQETYYKAKFGVYFKSSRVAINSITIDEFGELHGWFVTNDRGGINNSSLIKLAKDLEGIMKIHVAKVQTMKDPVITDLN